MYKAMSGPEGEWHDGVFSQAAPWQGYQASLEEFENGALGASSRVVPGAPWRFRVRRGRPVAGPGVAFQDGSLGRSFLQAFPRQQHRGMRGLGQAFRDGSLGDAVSDAACQAISPCLSTALSAPQPLDRALKDPFNQLVAVSLVGLAAYVFFKR